MLAVLIVAGVAYVIYQAYKNSSDAADFGVKNPNSWCCP
jgi:hypothetical protein